MKQRDKRPASLDKYDLRQVILLTLITVVFPARATNSKQRFALQLRGPFAAAVHAESHLSLLSVKPWHQVLFLFNVFMYLINEIIPKLDRLSRLFKIIHTP